MYRLPKTDAYTQNRSLFSPPSFSGCKWKNYYRETVETNICSTGAAPERERLSGAALCLVSACLPNWPWQSRLICSQSQKICHRYGEAETDIQWYRLVRINRSFGLTKLGIFYSLSKLERYILNKDFQHIKIIMLQKWIWWKCFNPKIQDKLMNALAKLYIFLMVYFCLFYIFHNIYSAFVLLYLYIEFVLCV